MKYLHIPSADAGKTWRAYVYKPQRGMAYASATEGIRTEFSFQTVLSLGGGGGSRNVKHPIGRATDKAKRAGMRSLVSALRANDFITDDAMAAAYAEIDAADTIES